MRVDLAREAPFALGVARVEPAACVVTWRDGHAVLQPRVMQVLVRLARAGGEVVSHEQLIADCWSGRAVSEDAIFRAVMKLRALLADIAAGSNGGGLELETIPRVGYRLIAPPGPASAPRTTIPPAAAPPDRLSGPIPARRVVLAAGGAALLLAGAGAAAWTLRRRAHSRAPLTLAVIPFADLSPAAADRAFLAAGFTQAVRDALSRIGGLRVIAEPSSASVALAGLPPEAAAARLGADLLLNGAVTESGGAVRVSLELLDPKTRLVAWSQTETGRADDLFRLLDAAAAAATEALVARIGPDRLRSPPALRRRDPVAFRNVLEANQLLEQSRTLRMTGRDADGEDAADRAWALAQAALRLDPGDVGAQLVLATATRNGWTRALAAQPATAAERAAAAAQVIRRALASDPNDPAALTALGDYYRRFEWRWAEAETLFRRAIAAAPSLVEAHWAYGYELGELGRAREGLVHAREVFRLDPENPYRRVALPRLLYISGDRAQALRRYDVELAAGPANAFLIREIYLMHLAEANVGALRRLAARLTDDLWRGRAMPPPVAALTVRIDAAVAALKGAPGDLLALVDADVAAFDSPGPAVAATREGRASVDLLFIYAMEYAWSGATDRALTLLARALAGRSLYWVASLPYGPAEFPPAVRRDPRYAALWRSDGRLAALIEARRTAAARHQTTAPYRHGPGWDG